MVRCPETIGGIVGVAIRERTMRAAIALTTSRCMSNDSNQRRQLTSDSAPAAFVRPLHLNCYAAISPG